MNAEKMVNRSLGAGDESGDPRKSRRGSAFVTHGRLAPNSAPEGVTCAKLRERDCAVRLRLCLVATFVTRNRLVLSRQGFGRKIERVA